MKILSHEISHRRVVLQLLVATSGFQPLCFAQQQVETGATEKGLFDLARPAHVNILADSTHFNDAATPEIFEPSSQSQSTAALLCYCAQKHRLTTRRFNSSTYLFWSRPDIKPIVDALVRGEGIGAEQNHLTAEALAARLSTLFPGPEKTHDEGTPNAQAQQTPPDALVNEVETQPLKLPFPVTHEFKLSQLPIDLQQQVTSLFVRKNAGADDGERDYSMLWFRHELWSKAKVVVIPANTSDRYSVPSLAVQCLIEAEGKRHLLSISAFDGINTTRVVPPTPLQVVDQHTEDVATVRVFSNTWTPDHKIPVVDDERPVELQDVLRPTGTASALLEKAKQDNAWRSEAQGLVAPVSVNVTRQPLDIFLTSVAKQTGVTLQVAPQVDAPAHLISAQVEKISLFDLMDAITQMYGLTWEQGANKTFSLVPSHNTPLENALVPLGYLSWYREYEFTTPAINRRKAEFDRFAANVVNEAGPRIMTAPGVTVASLSSATQEELRARTIDGLSIQAINAQPSPISLAKLEGEWALRFARQGIFPQSTPPVAAIPARFPTQEFVPIRQRLQLLVDGKLCTDVTLSFSLTPPQARK